MKILLKVSIVFIALSFFYFFKPVNKSSQNFLSLSEAEKIEKNIYNFFSIIIVIMALAIIYLPFYFKFQLLPQYENFSKGFEFELDSNHKALIKFDSISSFARSQTCFAFS